MRLQKEREMIVEYCQKMVTARLTTGTGGNMSFYNRETGEVAITPTGVDYFEMKAEDVLIMDIDENIIEGTRKPSSETAMHMTLYKKRKDINAIVHTHSVFATTIACLRWELPAVHYLVGFSGNKVPLAPYATYGTSELARNVAESIGHYNAVLMENHGLLAVGSSIPQAFGTAEEIELVAEIYYRTKCIGNPVILSDEEMEKIVLKFKGYGRQ
ncbi:L-fuculose-phosphate aldolase [Aminobacterium sp. MB27-C1]|jgi:L-fuculose-phosphate aldolase|uniref:L-fuculose-phosphate aldolase n=1 Tax=Aminobacterium sp. MB27-C1 TaxID=3070661 RepID=UPI001BCF6217|nr:L-fuculose-phosphate aldolase [Aminobacterium sp. MB27-C1]MDD4551686.1 L-fuculose-phosphate aldolase [Aminobacterium sp.]WMI70822.1 L-fuculose-phosphate aldolase [Aminobacterium sp. MB27-C1]